MDDTGGAGGSDDDAPTATTPAATTRPLPVTGGTGAALALLALLGAAALTRGRVRT